MPPSLTEAASAWVMDLGADNAFQKLYETLSAEQTWNHTQKEMQKKNAVIAIGQYNEH